MSIYLQFFEYFIDSFGQITIVQVAYFILAICFIVYCGKKISKYIIDRHEQDKIKDAQLKTALDAIEKYPEYRKQSLGIQAQLNQEIASIKESQLSMKARLDKMEQDAQQRERNKCRARLIQSYHYYADVDKNPMQAWTQMESEAFWEQFKDYENMNGDGYVHSEIQPAMELLDVIAMTDKERIVELMHSRH